MLDFRATKSSNCTSRRRYPPLRCIPVFAEMFGGPDLGAGWRPDSTVHLVAAGLSAVAMAVLILPSATGLRERAFIAVVKEVGITAQVALDPALAEQVAMAAVSGVDLGAARPSAD